MDNLDLDPEAPNNTPEDVVASPPDVENVAVSLPGAEDFGATVPAAAPLLEDIIGATLPDTGANQVGLHAPEPTEPALPLIKMDEVANMHAEPPSTIQRDDVGISLPNVEEAKANLPSQERPKKWRMIGLVAVCVLIFVVGLTAGLLATKGNNSNSASVQTEEPDDFVDSEDSEDVPDGLENEARLSAAFNFIEDMKISTKSHLVTPGSPQNKALNWIANQDAGTFQIPVSATAPSAFKFAQRYVLAVMYYSLDGMNWQYRNDFLSEFDECDWNRGVNTGGGKSFKFGVSCDVKGMVNELFMRKSSLLSSLGSQILNSPTLTCHSSLISAGNNLAGSIPLEMGFLSDLTHISAFDNQISGELPESMSWLSNLDFLALDSNKIAGTVPFWMEQLQSLETLALGDNLFNGKLPASISKMTSLTEVALDRNELSGSVDVFFNLTSLERLYLGNNQFEGKLDDNFFKGSKLRDLDIGSNFFAGTIPVHLFNDHHLHILDLHGNALIGDIPEEISANSKLTYFSAYDNQLSFDIPPTISNLHHLKHLDLSGNNFGGTIPTHLNLMTRLEYLFLSRNDFTAGPFPDLQNLVKLKDLSLKFTQVTGSIPSEIGLLTDLILLDLGNNQINGHLPKAMETLTKLRFLVMNNNELTGTITVGFRQLESIGKSFVNSIDGLVLECISVSYLDFTPQI